MSTANSSPNRFEQYREPAFVVVLFVGALIFSLGWAFLIIGVSINTAPPAPYVSSTDKQLLIVGSIVAILVGGLMIRTAARIVGW
jgi:hypothetical protein